MTDSTHNSIGHETDTGDVRAIVLAGVFLAVGVALVFLLIFGIFQFLKAHPFVVPRANPMAETQQQQFPPLPRLEEHPTVELQGLHAYEDHILSTYGWANKPAGQVRIPIGRAMELQLQRGFPVRKEAEKK